MPAYIRTQSYTVCRISHTRHQCYKSMFYYRACLPHSFFFAFFVFSLIFLSSRIRYVCALGDGRWWMCVSVDLRAYVPSETGNIYTNINTHTQHIELCVTYIFWRMCVRICVCSECAFMARDLVIAVCAVLLQRASSLHIELWISILLHLAVIVIVVVGVLFYFFFAFCSSK